MNLKIPEYWEKDNLIEIVSRYLFEGKLILILGAGVSSSLSLPDWEELVSRLYIANSEMEDTSFQISKRVEILREKHFKNNEENFKIAVQKELYKNCDLSFKKLSNLSLLPALGATIMSSRRGNASNVITFNFDNLLELYLGFHGFTINSCQTEKHWNTNSDVQIYHPHGCVPALPFQFFNSEKLIFSLNDFIKRISNPDHPWNIKLKALMSSHFCLFIGLRGEDIALTSLLQAVEKIHILDDSDSLFWGICFLRRRGEYEKSNWEQYRVLINEIEEHSEIHDFLFKVCQKAASY